MTETDQMAIPSYSSAQAGVAQHISLEIMQQYAPHAARAYAAYLATEDCRWCAKPLPYPEACWTLGFHGGIFCSSVCALQQLQRDSGLKRSWFHDGSPRVYGIFSLDAERLEANERYRSWRHRCWRAIANRLPAWIVYYAAVRLLRTATKKRHDTMVVRMTVWEALQHWEQSS